MLTIKLERLFKLKKGTALLFLFLICFQSFGKNSEKAVLNIEPKTKPIFLKTTALIHAFHTSITQIELNQKSKTFEISVRVFTDDLEKAINTKNKIKGTKILDDDNNDALVSSYISSCFSIISPTNKKNIYKYIGKEKEDLATWIYLELPAEALMKGSKIYQNVLMELYSDQVNIVNFKKSDERKSFLFDAKNKVKVWE
jgi:hypothetical protein